MSTEPHVGGSEAEEGAKAGYFLANKMGRIFYLALEEVAPGEPMNAILTSARVPERLDHRPPNDFDFEFPFDELAQVQQAMEELYGPSTGRALATQVGRACFRIGAEDLNPVLGLSDLVLQVLPLKLRFRVGFEVLAHLTDRFSDQIVRLEEDDRYFHWVIEPCGVCWERRCDAPCCDLLVGLLAEGAYWLSGGERFEVQEVSCVAAGDSTCTIRIGKSPLDEPASAEEGE